MQVDYPKKLSRTYWDPVHVNFPTKKFPDTGVSSETIARRWRGEPGLTKDVKRPIDQLKEYFRDYNLTNELSKSQTTVDYTFKLPGTKRFNKHTSCTENLYIYPPARNISDRPPYLNAHGTTEMKSAYIAPVTPARLVTDKDQFKHRASLLSDTPPVDPSWHKELEPLDTTHEGFEKYLDPYLTTSRLHHRPYTADQLDKLSCSKEVVTYYTFADIPWVRTPKPSIGNWRLPLSRPKSMYDREKLKEDFREIRSHNTLRFVPGSFRTESRDNYIHQTARAESQEPNYDGNVQTYYQRRLANLSTNALEEYSAVNKISKDTENSCYGSKKPICSMLNQFVDKNERLRKKNSIG